MKTIPEIRIIELRFPAIPDRMSLVRASVRSAVGFCGLDASATQEIVLAVGEACQNVMQHGYAGGKVGDIVLSIARDAKGVVVRVADFAPPINPERIKPRDLADVRPGGLGVHFIEALTDSAEFLPGPGGVGNILQMTKKLGVPS